MCYFKEKKRIFYDTQCISFSPKKLITIPFPYIIIRLAMPLRKDNKSEILLFFAITEFLVIYLYI